MTDFAITDDRMDANDVDVVVSRQLTPGRPRSRFALAMSSLLSLALTVSADAALAHDGHDHQRERVGEPRPEAWAMARASALVTPGGWSLVPAEGRWSLAVDLFELPHLDRRQRTVGFDGFKEENLNNSPVFGRLWIGALLPGAIGVHLGWTPPVRVQGAKPREMWSLLGQRRFDLRNWRFGIAAQAGRANVQGAFTCYDALIGSGPGDCLERSNDSFRSRYHGLELGFAYAPERWLVVPELTWARHHINAETQVRASFPGFDDRALLVLSRHITSISLGVRFDLPGQLNGRLALSHTPLKVKRRDRDQVESDDLNQIRLSVEYRR